MTKSSPGNSKSMPARTVIWKMGILDLRTLPSGDGITGDGITAGLGKIENGKLRKILLGQNFGTRDRT